MRPVMAKAIGYMKPDIDPNMRLYVPFNEGVGSVAKDYSQYGNHAQLTDVEWSPDGFNGAGKFNDSSSFGNCGNDASLNITEAITIEAWVKCDVFGVYRGIVTKFQSATGETQNSGYALIARSSNKFTFLKGNGTFEYTDSDIAYTDTNTHYIVGKRHNGVNHLYIDGIQQTAAGTQAISSSEIGLIVGRMYNSADSYYFNGTIGNVIIFSTIPSPAQIAADCYEVVCS